MKHAHGWIAAGVGFLVMCASLHSGGNPHGAAPFERLLEEVDGLRQVDGPLPGMAAWQAVDGPVTLVADLAADIAPRGSVAFWLRFNQPFRTGTEAQEFSAPLLEAPDLFSYRINANANSLQLLFRWQGLKPAADGDPPVVSMPVTMPGMPGPFWVHVAFEWDRDRGVMNGYLNGSPVRLPGGRSAPWTTPPGGTLKLVVGELPVAGVHVSSAMLDPDWFSAHVSPLYHRSLDGLLGIYTPDASSAASLRGELIYERSLDSESDVRDWVMEGPGVVTFEEGWMRLYSGNPDGADGRHGHFVYWPDVVLPEDFIAEWEIQFLDPVGLNIVFFCATGRGGEDVFDPALAARDGDFRQYHSGDLNSYHASYFSNTPGHFGRNTAHIRKNHGFFLVANGPVLIHAGNWAETHTVRVMKNGNRIELSVNGETSVEFTDDGKAYGPVLGTGRFGLRQMQWSDARYRNLRIYRLRG